MDRVVKVTCRDEGSYMFACPGCDTYHIVDGRWTFNGDMVKPTFRPSLKVTSLNGDKNHVCHSWITDGKILFLDDCTHKLAGLIVDIPEF